jgi:hypothetical protein
MDEEDISTIGDPESAYDKQLAARHNKRLACADSDEAIDEADEEYADEMLGMERPEISVGDDDFS